MSSTGNNIGCSITDLGLDLDLDLDLDFDFAFGSSTTALLGIGFLRRLLQALVGDLVCLVDGIDDAVSYPKRFGLDFTRRSLIVCVHVGLVNQTR